MRSRKRINGSEIITSDDSINKRDFLARKKHNNNYRSEALTNYEDGNLMKSYEQILEINSSTTKSLFSSTYIVHGARVTHTKDTDTNISSSYNLELGYLSYNFLIPFIVFSLTSFHKGRLLGDIKYNLDPV